MLDSLLAALHWIADRPALMGLIGLLVAWIWANVWKFNMPKTAMGRAILRTITSMTITAWNQWGKGKGWSPLPTVEEFEKEWADGTKATVTVEQPVPDSDDPKVLDGTVKTVEVSVSETPKS